MGISVTPHDQTNRLLRIDTALGKDALIVSSMAGEDRLSDDFEYTLNVFSETEHEIPAEKLVGTPITLDIQSADETLRHFHGYVREVTALGREYGGQRSRYSIEVVSWLWFLSKITDCRIFQEMTVEEVLKTLFEPLGDKAKFEFKLTQDHPRHRYLVQYNETSYTFAKRLMRREGIAFYITHADGEHTVHFVDDANSLPTLDPAVLELHAGHGNRHVTSWVRSNRFVTGRYAERAYNYKLPNDIQEVDAQAAGGAGKLPGAMDTEQYRYTEDYLDSSTGKADVDRRSRENVDQHEGVEGCADYRHLAVGHHFTIEQVPAGDWPDHGREFTLTRVHYDISNGGGAQVAAEFEAVPKGALRYPSYDQEPRIEGLQTAIVTGPSGEEIYTDTLGRIKVQFHWDREGKHDENTTCWLRVMQSFAGPAFGGHFTPRIGQEVVVAFENGNPERPFVIGALYHAEHAPPYAGQPTRSGIKTRSTKGGNENTANEIRFDDKSGSEEFYVQAEKDLAVYVKNNEQRTIDNNLTSHIKNNEKRRIDNDLEVGVKNNAEIKVGNDLILHAGNKITLVVGGSAITLTKSGIEIGGKLVDIDGGKVEIN